MFNKPHVNDEMELKWKAPDEEGLMQFLVEDKGFNKENVASAIEWLKKSKSKSNQCRLDSFFSKKPAPASDVKLPVKSAAKPTKK